MKIKKLFAYLVALIGVAALGTSCTTAYDAYGRPVTTVDPAAAVAAVAVAGTAGYLIGQNNRHHHHRHAPRVVRPVGPRRCR